jgi:hypothetical protein
MESSQNENVMIIDDENENFDELTFKQNKT